MKEEIFIELGFEKIIETAENSGAENDWYYYTLDIGDLCLLTSASDEIKDGNWYCYFFESNDFKINNETDLRELVRILCSIHKTTTE
jgi:hypothetical protein